MECCNYSWISSTVKLASARSKRYSMFDIRYPMFEIVVFILTNLFFNPIFVVSDDGVCEGNEVQAYYRLNVDARGMGLCGVSPAPLQTIEHTQHHGECLASCAEFPGCFSYNFYHNSTRCELFCVPERYAISPNCSNYLVRVCRVYFIILYLQVTDTQVIFITNIRISSH